MKQFRKKPVVIEAVQIDTGDYDGMCDIISWINSNGGLSWATDVDDFVIVVQTLEGNMYAKHDDMIIKGVKGEFYPCKPDIFEATYEEV